MQDLREASVQTPIPRPSREVRQHERDLERQLREIRQREEDLQRQLRELQQNSQRQQQREGNLQMQLRETQQREENSQRQLREMQQREGHLERQLRETQQREENSQRQLREMQQREGNLERQLRETQQREENSQRQLREMQQREGNLEMQLREIQQREGNSQRQLREMQQNSQRQLRETQQREENLESQLREMRQRFENSQQRVSTLERQLRDKDQEVNELVLSLSLAQQTISEQQQQKSCDWVISRDEIQMTNKCLGRGGWGSVYEGVYCGCTVAVKQIHDLILSPHNIRLFEREMNIASKCRHPHLLQFIGATNDEGNPLFVTELMEKSLRALLEQRQLSQIEIRAILLDIARAINYLHQKKPEPIIHRDVSSANVLLWRQGDQWRGKVSDYGTANFMQQTMTVAPGAMIYCAPEALTSKQTVKVDVYSFGVLLCEMCVRELPDPRRREQQVLVMTNHVLRGLVRRCLQTDPEARPTMQRIIDELSRSV
ncbi:unnamed protein product [Porites evermanni]|uniref:Protein kinase domain-containing protein n=1 Tax=Porites evermanni TaxID=104178 RepID=A0ABN8MFC8_9CNID|nr:unnamed protein product [Porites evermanni]